VSFHSWQYGVLLVVTLIAYWCLARHRTARLWVMVAASMFYYGSFAPWFLWLLLITIAVDYCVARAMERADRNDPSRCAWDALVFSSPGRYLWLQLVLRGDGRQTPCVSAAIVDYPRISLRRYLPSVFSFVASSTVSLLNEPAP